MTAAPPPIRGEPLGALLADIASAEPSPGSGAAGAAALALGIACARKAISITLLHHPDDAALGAADARLAELERAACDGADADARRFSGLIDALQQPHDAPAEAADRTAAIAKRTAALIALGERLVALGEEAECVIAGIEHRLAAQMANDVTAARALIAANRTIQQANLAESRRRLAS